MNPLWKRWFGIFVGGLLAISIGGCESSSAYLPRITPADVHADVTDTDTQSNLAETQRNDLIGKLDMRARESAFQETVQLVEEMVDSPSELLWMEEDLNVGVAFLVPHYQAEESIASWQCRLLDKECYLFRIEKNIGASDACDRLALVPTKDVYEVVRLVGTNGNGFEYNQKELTTSDIIEWLKDLSHKQPLQITGVGVDFVEGLYLTRIKNPDELATRICTFSPDAVDLRTDKEEGLVAALHAGELCLWWE